MDHERVTIGSSAMSCGILELSRISEDTEDVLYAVASRLYHPSRGSPAAIVVWSDLHNGSASFKLWKRATSFGTASISDKVENPKTGNIIVLYSWIVDHEKLKTWYIEKRVARLRRAGA